MTDSVEKGAGSPRGKRMPINDGFPIVSVVMPVRNEAGFIARSLGAVLAQDYPSDRMEVIVSDGMSDDGTREVVHAAAKSDGRVRLVDNEGRIAPTALNAALACARGRLDLVRPTAGRRPPVLR